MFRKLLSRLFEGISFGTGILVVLFLLFVGVYAFSGPSQGPEAGDNYISSSSPISSIYSSLVGAYDSSSFSANSEGNVFERLEDIKDTVSSSGGSTPSDWTCAIRENGGWGETSPIAWCVGNEKLIAGGCYSSESSASFHSSFPRVGGQGWQCNFKSGSGYNAVYINCCS